ncbi:hypothetical protein WMY93_011298 [Mugilogobius chulae]|uniref:Secreted protein n=1 Tax=Mugilogobius chulae TaxID=88201 RepID=A0AAW0P1L3_9GOBI
MSSCGAWLICTAVHLCCLCLHGPGLIHVLPEDIPELSHQRKASHLQAGAGSVHTFDRARIESDFRPSPPAPSVPHCSWAFMQETRLRRSELSPQVVTSQQGLVWPRPTAQLTRRTSTRK